MISKARGARGSVPRSVGRSIVGRYRSAPARTWRRRGRKAQVSAVATILGLLLVVTFVANYLTTTLPQYMAINDVNHDLQVENEVGRLAALLEASSAHDALDAQLSQPVELGSQGLPPFAAPDGGIIGPATGGSQEKVGFAVTGPFDPPTTGIGNHGVYTKLLCSATPTGSAKPTGITCLAAASVTWNFSAGNGEKYSVSGTGGLTTFLNFSTNLSHISVASIGGATDRLYVEGSNNTVYLNATGGATETVLIVGSYDTLNLGTTGGATFKVTVVGSHDSVVATTTGGVTISESAYGVHDSFSESESGGGTYRIYYTGFRIAAPQGSRCPVKNLALTDTVAGTPGGSVNYNDTTYTNSGHTGNASGWTYTYANPATTSCPYVLGDVIAENSIGAGAVVQLENRYNPIAQVAYDYGAVVFTQQNGVPGFIDPPPIKLVSGAATIWVPVFTTTLSSEGGIGTAIVEVSLLSTTTEKYPASGFEIASSDVTITLKTPYASAWMAYFASSSEFAGDASCLPSGSTVCSPTGEFTTTGSLGLITLTLPVTSITLEVATFSVGLD